MQDPYLKDYDAYLNSLERFEAPRRTPLFQESRKIGSTPVLRAALVIAACVLLFVQVPWGA